MPIQYYRKQRRLTQKELAHLSGINFRSLQDYEQGHKRLSSANGDSLIKLSLALGCTVEELFLESPENPAAPLNPENSVPPEIITAQPLFCEKYQIPIRWKLDETGLYTVFYYDGRIHKLPFSAVFTEEKLPWIAEAANLQVESAIDEAVFQKQTSTWEV